MSMFDLSDIDLTGLNRDDLFAAFIDAAIIGSSDDAAFSATFDDPDLDGDIDVPGQPDADNLPAPAFGFCPICGRRGIRRERRKGGRDKCEGGHVYPSMMALAVNPLAGRAVFADDGRGRLAPPVAAFASDDADGRWVTIEGTHVFIRNGRIEKGPANLAGKKLSDLPDRGASVKSAKTVPLHHVIAHKIDQGDHAGALDALRTATKPGDAQKAFSKLSDYHKAKLDEADSKSDGRGRLTTPTTPAKPSTPPVKSAAAGPMPDKSIPDFIRRNGLADWRDKLDETAKGYVAFYQSSAFSTNTWLRSADPYHDYVTGKRVRALDAAIDKAPPLKEPATVLRGIQFDTAENAAKFLASAKPGAEFQDHAYVSTTLSGDYAKEFFGVKSTSNVEMEIRLPAGTKAAYMGGGDPTFEKEQELLLQRGAKFRVTSVGEGAAGGRRIVVEYVGSSPRPLPDDPNRERIEAAKARVAARQAAGAAFAAEPKGGRAKRFVWTPDDLVPVGKAELSADFYFPDQPRHPAGSADGGEWTSGGSAMRGHHLEGKTREQAVAALIEAKGKTGEHAAKLETMKAPKGVENTLAAYVKAHSGGFDLPTLKAAYENAAAKHPGLTIAQFHGAVVRATRQGLVRPSAYSQAVATIPHPEHALPLDGELKYYLHKGPNIDKAAVFCAEFFDPNQPRDDRGRWTAGAGTDAARQHYAQQIRGYAKRAGIPTREEAAALADHLSRLTTTQLHALRKEHGLKASAPDKAGLVQKLAERFAIHRSKNPVIPSGHRPKPLTPVSASALEAIKARAGKASVPMPSAARTTEPTHDAEKEKYVQAHIASEIEKTKGNIQWQQGKLAAAGKNDARAKEKARENIRDLEHHLSQLQGPEKHPGTGMDTARGRERAKAEGRYEDGRGAKAGVTTPPVKAAGPTIEETPGHWAGRYKVGEKYFTSKKDAADEVKRIQVEASAPKESPKPPAAPAKEESLSQRWSKSAAEWERVARAGRERSYQQRAEGLATAHGISTEQAKAAMKQAIDAVVKHDPRPLHQIEDEFAAKAKSAPPPDPRARLGPVENPMRQKPATTETPAYREPSAVQKMTASQLRDAVTQHFARTGGRMGPGLHAHLYSLGHDEDRLRSGKHANGVRLSEGEKEQLQRRVQMAKEKVGRLLRGEPATFADDVADDGRGRLVEA